MKKAFGYLMILATLVLSACSPPATTATKKNDATTNTNAVSSSKSSQDEVSSKEEQEKSAEEVKEDSQLTSIKKGETLAVDGYAEISVVKQKFAKKIEPSNPGSFYTYYESKEEDSTFFALTAKVKNLYTTGIDASDIASVKLIYDNQYDYTTFSTVEEKGGQNFTYSNITSISPLKTATLIYLAEIPNEVAKSDKPLKAIISIKDKEYEYSIR